MCVASSVAQTTPEEVKADLNKSGGVYYAYPVSEAVSTPAPAGYKPFHISHYGRHGSRYLISDNDYSQVSDLLHKAAEAHALTPLGKDVMMRVDSVMKEASGRGGDLSPLGVRQHKGIAKRMYANYPEVFTDSSDITAKSTVVIRCVLSMDAFCEGLKEENPALDITRESSNRYMHYMNYHSPESQAYTSKEWKEEYRKFEEEHSNPDRLVASIFSDPEFVRKNVNPHDFMWGMYWLASGMQDIETPLSFYDVFTPDELFDLWQCFNYRFYACDGNYAGNRGLLVANAKPLLTNVLETAEAAMLSEKPSAALRFGHDGNLIPYAALLQLDGCYESISDPKDFYKVFSDFKVAPMAGNIQLIFYRNGEGDVLVKFLHNEQEKSIPVKTDMYPYYKWADVKEHFLHQLGN
ncbi:MAG: histidine-type phosphatase [Muribaculaceae bacterium]|nr:histidine-type phosphatase [Muribaculaceae bacterium]